MIDFFSIISKVMGLETAKSYYSKRLDISFFEGGIYSIDKGIVYGYKKDIYDILDTLCTKYFDILTSAEKNYLIIEVPKEVKKYLTF